MIFDFASLRMPKDSEFRPAVLKRAADTLAAKPHSQREFTILAGDINSERGNYKKAVENFRAALISQPNDLETRVKLAKALIDSGNREEAKEVAEEIRKDSEGSYNKIMKYLNTGEGFR